MPQLNLKRKQFIIIVLSLALLCLSSLYFRQVSADASEYLASASRPQTKSWLNSPSLLDETTNRTIQRCKSDAVKYCRRGPGNSIPLDLCLAMLDCAELSAPKLHGGKGTSGVLNANMPKQVVVACAKTFRKFGCHENAGRRFGIPFRICETFAHCILLPLKPPRGIDEATAAAFRVVQQLKISVGLFAHLVLNTLNALEGLLLLLAARSLVRRARKQAQVQSDVERYNNLIRIYDPKWDTVHEFEDDTYEIGEVGDDGEHVVIIIDE